MAMNEIQLPPDANLSIAGFGDVFRSQGFIIEQLTEDRLQAQARTSAYSDIFPVERWFPAARIVIERSVAGFTISYRPPIRRVAVTSLTYGLLMFATVPGSMTTRLWFGAALAGLLAVINLRGVKRRRMLLAIGRGVGATPDVLP
jgi:hypothetical protein